MQEQTWTVYIFLFRYLSACILECYSLQIFRKYKPVLNKTSVSKPINKPLEPRKNSHIYALTQRFKCEEKRLWVGYPERVQNWGLRVKETPGCILSDILQPIAAINLCQRSHIGPWRAALSFLPWWKVCFITCSLCAQYFHALRGILGNWVYIELSPLEFCTLNSYIYEVHCNLWDLVLSMRLKLIKLKSE